MKLVSYLDGGHEHLGVMIGDRVLGTRSLGQALPATIAGVLEHPHRALAAIATAVAEHLGRFETDGASFDSIELLPPVPRPGKIVAIGVNYRDHATEGGSSAPPAPLVFAKFPSALVAHGADIRWDPAMTGQVDYEAELAVVIGTRARRVSEDEALDHVLGYTCLNDISARDLQFADVQWVRGKSLDTFCPMGPALVTADDIPDPQTLSVSCSVNGEILQSASTADMVHSVAVLISYCSRSFTLEPGDVISTGTPSGVGVFRDPQRFLGNGDEVVVEIDGVGRLVNRCTEEAALVGPVRG